MSAYSPVKSLELYVEKMGQAMKKKKANTIMYDDPEATSISDPDLLQALNKKISEDPNYPVPEGYMKKKEKNLVYSYGAPTYFPLSEAQKDSMEILDELIFEKCGFHFLEPICTFEETIKIRPKIHKERPKTN